MLSFGKRMKRKYVLLAIIITTLHYLVRTSSLHRLMIQESSNKIGNHPLTQTLSAGATFMSSLVYSLKTCEQMRADKSVHIQYYLIRSGCKIDKKSKQNQKMFKKDFKRT